MRCVRSHYKFDLALENSADFPQYVTEKFYVNLEAGEFLILYSTLQYCSVLCCSVLRHAVLSSAMLCFLMPCSTALCTS